MPPAPPKKKTFVTVKSFGSWGRHHRKPNNDRKHIYMVASFV